MPADSPTAYPGRTRLAAAGGDRVLLGPLASGLGLEPRLVGAACGPATVAPPCTLSTGPGRPARRGRGAQSCPRRRARGSSSLTRTAPRSRTMSAMKDCRSRASTSPLLSRRYGHTMASQRWITRRQKSTEFNGPIDQNSTSGLPESYAQALDRASRSGKSVAHLVGICWILVPVRRQGAEMSRPQTEAGYLAGLVPPSVAGVGRRGFLKGALGTGAALSMPALLAACGGDDDTSSGGGKPTGTVTLRLQRGGRRRSQAAAERPRRGLPEDLRAEAVKVNAVDHNTFQENINNYLQGNPDDVFSWFAGYRMRFFAERGLIGDISDVWPTSTACPTRSRRRRPATTASSTSCPSPYYPWAVFYRKSRLGGAGYTVADDAGRDDHAGQADADRRARPDRLRRQGRLAGDGHVRHPQHADQRLRVPRRT